MNYPRIIIAGTHSGVGKTTIALGIMLAFEKMGLKVQPFKAGPDYIDPSYHTEVTGRVSCNLDTWLVPRKALLELFLRRAKDADISIIEGVMGLYDGLREGEKGSTALLAKILGSPVILVVNARSLSRSAAAVVLGYKEFDPQVKIAGVILNNIGSLNHYQHTKKAIENRTKIPVLGFLPKDADLKLTERHLGLIPSDEQSVSEEFKEKLLRLMQENIDFKKIAAISIESKKLGDTKRIMGGKSKKVKVKIAIAKDKAFNFYYQDNLDILKHLGAELVEFSPLESENLSEDIDGLYIGGGFPELFAEKLSKNTRIKEEIYQRAKESLPVYAECGGLMYLGKRLIDFEKKEFPMVGIFKFTVRMANKLQALGYVELETLKDNILSKAGEKNKGHVFHWSYLDEIPPDNLFVYRIEKKNNVFYEGLKEKNVLATYVHVHFASNNRLAKNFIRSCETYRRIRNAEKAE